MPAAYFTHIIIWCLKVRWNFKKYNKICILFWGRKTYIKYPRRDSEAHAQNMKENRVWEQILNNSIFWYNEIEIQYLISYINKIKKEVNIYAI